MKKARKNNKKRLTNWRLFGAYKHWFTVDWFFVMETKANPVLLYFPANVCRWSAVKYKVVGDNWWDFSYLHDNNDFRTMVFRAVKKAKHK